MSLSIAHICIKTASLGETERFYTEALGLTKVFDFTKKGRQVGCYLKVADGQFLEIFEEAIPKTPPSHMAHLCLETDDIHGMVARLNDFGVATTPVKRGCDHTYQTWFKDPSGIDIELHQYTDMSTQYTGQNVEIDW
jgi:catechol 2,3-dioxygenase-like lactoylglutathione lyase family enzyme